MPVLAFVGNKGGAGKTTLSVNIAAGIGQENSVAIVDADPQGSTLQWRAFSDNENALNVYEAEDDLQQQANRLLENYNYVVFDCPPSVHAPQTMSVLSFSQSAVIPVQPSPVDLWATVHIEEAVSNAREVNPNLKALLVINQLESRTTFSKVVRDAVNEIGLPVAKTSLRRRAIYRNSALEGKSIFEMGYRGKDARLELEQLIEEVMTL